MKEDEDCVTLELRTGECIALRPVGGAGDRALKGICSAPVGSFPDAVVATAVV